VLYETYCDRNIREHGTLKVNRISTDAAMFDNSSRCIQIPTESSTADNKPSKCPLSIMQPNYSLSCYPFYICI